MVSIGIPILLMFVAFLVTMFVYPYVLKFARKHNIVDNPNARKLQRVPVPVMGGTTVFIGLLISGWIGLAILGDMSIFTILALLFVMYAIGLWDDVKDIPPAFRLVVEMIVVWMMILLLDVEINDLHGLWGVRGLPDAVSVPLSLIAGVGIINAINLIDGVDGYCSTYGMMACVVFGLIFYYAGDTNMFALALMCAGALLPFFFHNVFGKSSKMFLGDGGSLMLGTLLTLFVFRTLSTNSPCADYSDAGISLVALSLAIMAVPVFDTLKVMIFRVAKGQSPFHPDKTHLHHLFIEMNYSHLATSAIIVTGNFLIIAILLVTWLLGASINLQVYLVVLLALLFTWGFYFFMEREHRKNDGEGSKYFQRACRRGSATRVTGTRAWLFIRRAVDSRFLAGKPSAYDTPPDKGQDGQGNRPDPRIQ